MNIGKVYVIPSFRCNLSCKHCNLHDKNTELTEDFFNKLGEIRGSNLILFGGEPFLNDITILRRIFDTAIVHSISSNMLLFSDDILKLMNEYEIDKIATSFNQFRFLKYQYKKWIDNIQFAINNNIKITILITLTEDLSIDCIDTLLKDLSLLDSNCNIDGIRFEPLIPITEELRSWSDNFLIELSKYWKYGIANLTEREYLYGNINICKNIFSLLPNGELTNSCPTGKNEKFFLTRCMDCDYSDICKPCIKQNNCSFFNKFYDFVHTRELYAKLKTQHLSQHYLSK